MPEGRSGLVRALDNIIGNLHRNRSRSSVAYPENRPMRNMLKCKARAPHRCA